MPTGYRTLLFGFSALLLFSQPARAGTDLEEGVKLYAAKNYVKALPLLEKAAMMSPMSWQAHYYLANTNLALGRMAAAKYEYELCRKTCNKPAIIAQCKEGILRAERHSMQTAPSAAGAKSSDPESESAGSRGLSDAQVAANRKKEDIMKEARAAVARIKQDAKEQLEHEKANANQYYQYPDGSVGTDIDHEREAEIQREADEKCRKIMDAAERRLKSIR